MGEEILKLTESIVKEIAESDIETLWEHFAMMDNPDEFEDINDYDDYKELRNNIWFGFDVRFSIFDIWENRVIIKGGKAIIFDVETKKRMEYDLEDYRAEKLKRTIEMRQYIYKNMVSENPLKPR